jgi:serine protease Do
MIRSSFLKRASSRGAGIDLASAVQIKKHLASFEKGDRVTFKFLRNGEQKETYWVVE